MTAGQRKHDFSNVICIKNKKNITTLFSHEFIGLPIGIRKFWQGFRDEINSLLPDLDFAVASLCTVEKDRGCQEFHKMHMADDNSLSFSDCKDVSGSELAHFVKSVIGY